MRCVTPRLPGRRTGGGQSERTESEKGGRGRERGKEGAWTRETGKSGRVKQIVMRKDTRVKKGSAIIQQAMDESERKRASKGRTGRKRERERERGGR